MPVQSVTAAPVLLPGPGLPVSLWQWLARLPDPRDPRGVRFTVPCVIATAIAARLAGRDSFTAIGEWAASRPQRVLKTLGCPRSKTAGVHIAPSEKTVRRICGLIDHDLAGDLLCGWTAELAAACEIVSPARLQERRRDQARAARARARRAGTGRLRQPGEAAAQGPGEGPQDRRCDSGGQRGSRRRRPR